MNTYEIRVIERMVKVYRVEAESKAHAEELYEEGISLDSEFPIDAEGPFIEEVVTGRNGR